MDNETVVSALETLIELNNEHDSMIRDYEQLGADLKVCVDDMKAQIAIIAEHFGVRTLHELQKDRLHKYFGITPTHVPSPDTV